MTQPIVHFSDVTKSYTGQPVLAGVNLDLGEGEFLGLVGLNGAGKTTMIKCMLDFISMDSGSISICGRPAASTSARADLAYLPEKFTPPYYLTGRDYLEYMARLYATPLDLDRVRDIFRTLDLTEAALSRPVRQLSKGMSQKLGLAACLLSGKRLLILDEPMSGLDPRARAYLKQYLLELKARREVSIFFSTHLLHDVEALCDRVAILHQGRIRFAGTPSECCGQFAAGDFEQAYLACIGD